jgi:hypothetical protein
VWMGKMTVWMPWSEGGACMIIGSSQLCQQWMLLQRVCWTSYIAIVTIPASHSAAIVDETAYHVLLPIDSAKVEKCENVHNISVPEESDDDDESLFRVRYVHTE